jgi:hypothetical protein
MVRPVLCVCVSIIFFISMSSRKFLFFYFSFRHKLYPFQNVPLLFQMSHFKTYL